MTLTDVWNFMGDNKAVISLWGLAMAATMPEEPPASIREAPKWTYHWLHQTVHAFISFRSPTATQSSVTTQVTPAGSLQVSQSSSTPAPEPDKMKASDEGAQKDDLPR